MLIELIQHAAAFLSSNPALVGMVIAAEEFLKKAMVKYLWFKGGVRVAAAFILAALFVIPEFPPVVTPELVAEIVAVGGVAAGLFSAGQVIIKEK